MIKKRNKVEFPKPFPKDEIDKMIYTPKEIEGIFWGTSNHQVVLALDNWMRTCDCSLSTVKRIKSICEEILKK